MSTIGLQYNRWTVISEARLVNGHSLVDARCSCGVVKSMRLAVLKFGAIKSCGCLKRELVAARNRADSVDIPVGSTFGRLTTTALPDSGGHNRQVQCQCDCGTKKLANVSALLAGSSRSCGCLRSELVAEKNRTHGLSKNALYSVWGSMKDRCSNPNAAHWHSYGGRGVKVCPEWFNSFETFYLDVGEPPFTGASLDRKDNDGDYCKSNVRWATVAQQMANTSRNKKYLYRGVECMLKDIAMAENINKGTLYYRINTMNLSIDEAIGLPRYGLTPAKVQFLPLPLPTEE